MTLPLLRQQRDTPPPPPPIDAFLDQPTRLSGLYILSAYSFGGMLIGLCIHSFPSFRPVALACGIVSALILTAVTGYPVLQENIASQRSRGMKRLYPGKTGRPRLVDGSVLLAGLTPAAAFLLLIATGFVIGML